MNLEKENEKNKIKIFIPSYLSCLAVVRAMIRTYLKEHNVNKTDEVQAISVVDELATNAIEHAYGYQNGEIKIILNIYNETLFLVIEDFGKGFNEESVSKEDGGVGLTIAKKLVDVFKIEKKEKGTIFKIEKKIKEAI